MNDIDLSRLLRIIASKDGGLDVAIEILVARLFANKSEKREHSYSIISLGKSLISQISFTDAANGQGRMDFRLSEIVNICLSDDDSAEAAAIISRKLATAFSKYDAHPIHYPLLLKSLSINQPLVFLDEFLGNSDAYIPNISINDLDSKNDPVSNIEIDIILKWCNADPIVRYPLVAGSISPYRHNSDETKLEWTPIAMSIINNAPDSYTVLNELRRCFRPISWSGSRSDTMKKRLSLIADLKDRRNPLVREWGYSEERRFMEEINLEREQEQERNRSRVEGFE